MGQRLVTPSKVTAWLERPHYLTLESRVAAGTLTRPYSVSGSYAELLRDKGNAGTASPAPVAARRYVPRRGKQYRFHP